MTNKSAGPIDEVKKLRQANGYSNAPIHVNQALSKFTSYYTDAVHSRLLARRRPRDLGQKINRAHGTRLRGRFSSFFRAIEVATKQRRCLRCLPLCALPDFLAAAGVSPGVVPCVDQGRSTSCICLLY